MFSEDEVKEFNKLFSEIGLTDETTQKKILEFLYTFGTIAYNNISTLNKIGYGKEEAKENKGC